MHSLVHKNGEWEKSMMKKYNSKSIVLLYIKKLKLKRKQQFDKYKTKNSINILNS